MRFHAYWQSVTENEMFMIIKLDVARSAVLPFWVIFFVERRLSLQVLIYCLIYVPTKYNERKLYSDTSPF